MRKLLALVAVFAVAQVAHADDHMNTSAELRVRATNNKTAEGNEDAGTRNSDYTQRFKLGLDFTSGEKFSATGTLLHNTMWGQTIGGTTDPTADSGSQVRDGIGDAQNMLLVQEAYGSWMLSDSTTMKFGRGGFEMADGTVVAKNDWEENPYAFDGFMISHDMEFGRLSGYYVKFADYSATDSAGVDDPEAQSYGLNLDIKAVPDMIKMLNIHIIQNSKDELTGAVTAGESSMRYGLTVKGETNGVDFRFSYSSKSGENTLEWATGGTDSNVDISSNMMDLEVGYTLADVMGLRVFFNYHTDTGTCYEAECDTNENYDSYFYDKHKYGGPMDIFMWGNLTYTHVGATLMPMDNLTVGFDYLMFSQTEKTGDTMAGRNGAAFAVAGAAGDEEDDLGTEMDLWATKKYDNGLEMTARYSMFTGGDQFDTGTPATSLTDTYTQMFLEARMTF